MPCDLDGKDALAPDLGLAPIFIPENGLAARDERPRGVHENATHYRDVRLVLGDPGDGVREGIVLRVVPGGERPARARDRERTAVPPVGPVPVLREVALGRGLAGRRNALQEAGRPHIVPPFCLQPGRRRAGALWVDREPPRFVAPTRATILQ